MNLKAIRAIAIITGLIGTTLINRFMEGGVIFMSLILICLLTSLFFTFKSFMNLKTAPDAAMNTLQLIKDCGAIAVAVGVMGTLIGLISAFDIIEATGPVAPQIMVGGLKVALLCPLFGLFTFGVSRLASLIIRVLVH